jgi:hypothetical protein
MPAVQDGVVRLSTGPQRQPNRSLVSMRAERLFLAHLAETANITDACRVARIAKSTVYKRKRERPEFAAAWERSVVQAYGRLEAEMLARALEPPAGGGEDGGDDGDGAAIVADRLPPLSDTMRMTLLTRHYATVDRHRRGRGAVAAVDTVRLRRDILNRFDKIAHKLGLEVPPE